jgi:hypothetical protein
MWAAFLMVFVTGFLTGAGVMAHNYTKHLRESNRWLEEHADRLRKIKGV